MIPILRKAVVELGKESPDLSYIRGMLEVLIETNSPPKLMVTAPVFTASAAPTPAGTPSVGNLDEIRRIATESQGL